MRYNEPKHHKHLGFSAGHGGRPNRRTTAAQHPKLPVCPARTKRQTALIEGSPTYKTNNLIESNMGGSRTRWSISGNADWWAGARGRVPTRRVYNRTTQMLRCGRSYTTDLGINRRYGLHTQATPRRRPYPPQTAELECDGPAGLRYNIKGITGDVIHPVWETVIISTNDISLCDNGLLIQLGRSYSQRRRSTLMSSHPGDDDAHPAPIPLSSGGELVSGDDGDSPADGGDGTDDRPTGQQAIEAAVRINEEILDIQHTSHIITLEAVAILDISGQHCPIKTGHIMTVASRICDRPRTRRIVDNSLETLDDRGFITRRPSQEANAYDCRLTEKGRAFFRQIGSMGFLRNLAETEVVEDV